MPSFWRVINQVIRDADVILEVLDARFVDETRNPEVERKVAEAQKPLIFVINKCDLIPQELAEAYKKRLRNSVFLSSTERQGTAILRSYILRMAPHKDHVRAGVVGYPNTGKSSVINALRGGGPAKTSSSSGFTHGRQNIRLSKKVTIIDTPGVIPYREKNDIKHAIIGTRNPEQLEAPENAVMALMSRFPALIESHYGIPAPLDLAHADHENTLEAIALRYGRIRKGGLPDTVTMARIILADWQQGKISLKDYRFSAL